MKYKCVFTISKNNSESNLTTSAQDTIVYDKFQVENHIFFKVAAHLPGPMN